MLTIRQNLIKPSRDGSTYPTGNDPPRAPPTGPKADVSDIDRSFDPSLIHLGSQWRIFQAPTTYDAQKEGIRSIHSAQEAQLSVSRSTTPQWSFFPFPFVPIPHISFEHYKALARHVGFVCVYFFFSLFLSSTFPYVLYARLISNPREQIFVSWIIRDSCQPHTTTQVGQIADPQ